jgi:hypothetical protein
MRRNTVVFLRALLKEALFVFILALREQFFETGKNIGKTEFTGRIKSFIQINGADQCFERIGEVRIPLAAAARFLPA